MDLCSCHILVGEKHHKVPNGTVSHSSKFLAEPLALLVCFLCGFCSSNFHSFAGTRRKDGQGSKRSLTGSSDGFKQNVFA